MTWIIGESPGHEPGPALSASGASGRRIARLCGLSLEDYEARFERWNLIETPDSWNAEEARSAALDLLSDMLRRRADRAILLGRRVEEAMLGGAPRQWFVPERVTYQSRVRFWRSREIEWTAAPHPSGRSRWWNEPSNVARAREFWHAQADR